MEFAHKIINKLFPSRCIVCQQTVDIPVPSSAAGEQFIEICSDCYQALPHNQPCCHRCSLPLADDIKNEVLCGRCLKNTPEFDYSYSLFRYEGNIINLIHQLKFKEKITYTRSLGELLAKVVYEKILQQQGRPECIIPVPLHDSRLRSRGYNQSTEISRAISKRTGITIDQNVVTRQRSTRMQTGLKSVERRQNIRGAFRIFENVSYKHVLVVDDVITTGSTVNELATVLKRNGIKKVGVLSIARAPLKSSV